jgi:chromate reductase
MRVMLVSGSLRGRSSSTALLRTAQIASPEGVTAVLFDGLGDLPHFNPDDDVDPLHPAVADLRAQIRGADALLLSTPEYAGALPGSFKNLLEWAIGDGQAGSIYKKPVAWINASASTGATDAHESLRKVLRYTGSEVVESACADVPVPRQAVGEDGLIADLVIRERVTRVLMALALHAAGRHQDSIGIVPDHRHRAGGET